MMYCNHQVHRDFLITLYIQGGSNMTGTDLCVNKPHLSRSYLNHLVCIYIYIYIPHYFTLLFFFHDSAATEISFKGLQMTLAYIQISACESRIHVKAIVVLDPDWSSGLRRGSATAPLLGLRVLVPLGARTSLSCERCVLSSRGLCDVPIPRPEEFYRLWCVVCVI